MLLDRTMFFASCAASCALASAAAIFAACSSGTVNGAAPGDAGHAASADAGDGTTCKPCVSDGDCAGAVCAQIAGDSYCMPACGAGGVCASDLACDAVKTAAGAQANVCLPLADICGSGQSPSDAGARAPCSAYAAPTTPSTCATCDGGHCQANGCRHGLACNTQSSTCEQEPAACGGAGVVFDGGSEVSGSVTASGGAVSRLYFAVVGDTRPPNPDDIAGYPTAIIDGIFTDVAAMKPTPSFVVSTGDYMFATTTGTEQGPQMDLYLAARAKYAGPQFPAMGNHECTGATASNCGTGNADGITPNYTTFLTRMLAPIGQTLPYYVVHVSAVDASWTAKLVFIAANAWDATQQAWLDQALAETTTYTFVVRHESASANTAPGVTPSEAITAKHPYTLEIVGHTHTYSHPSPKVALVGNGGAPLSGSGNYGFGVFSQQSDGSIAVDMIDYASGLADGTFHFAVKADGTAAP
jgi:hypothetical protein